MHFTQPYWIYGLGFFAQSLFGARLLVQLFQSERQGRVVSPTVFWQLSLMASFLFLIYGIVRNDAVIILGQTLSYFIYIRNLQLKNDWKKIAAPLRTALWLMPVVALAWVAFGADQKWMSVLAENDFTSPVIILGAIGQLMLNFRFVYQWYHSEKQKTSILPLGFWVISTVASVLILQYAVAVSEPVLLVAQSMGIVVYVRNVLLHFKQRRKAVA